MRVALIIASAIALAVALVLAVGGEDEDDAPVVETTPVTTSETAPEAVETTPEETGEPEPEPDEPETARECGRIVFEPNTDSGASSIQAAGTDCATARTVARAARNASDELMFEANGFRCAGGQADQPLSAIEWFCIGADRSVVSFLTS